MTSKQAGIILQHIRRIAGISRAARPPDAQLLERFTAQHDEAAFAALVRRHGPMVLNVCRSVLHHEHDAEDAFQATFLVLVRKAHSIRQPEAIAGWLYEVAYHVALKAQAEAARRRVQERRASPMAAADPTLDMTLRDLRRVLHEELRRLPEKYRLPLVLCYLEGRSQEEAADQLGWSKGALRGRLDRGREHLRRRLAARGLALSALLCATAVAPTATAEALVNAVVQGAVQCAVPGAVSARVSSLAEGAIRAMFISKLKIATGLLLAVMLAAGGGALARQTFTATAAQPGDQKSEARSQKAEPAAAKDAAEENNHFSVYSGRVLGPDGQPVAGARLYSSPWLEGGARGLQDVPVTLRGNTSPDGRFSLKIPRSQVQPGHRVTVVAAADGFGFDLVELPQKDRSGDLVLRLVKDVPVRGRLLGLEGKPIPGVRINVTVVNVAEDPNALLKALQQDWSAVQAALTKHLYQPMTKVLRITASDNDGRFEIAGVGADRWLGIDIVHPAVARFPILVVTHDGLNYKAIAENYAKSHRDPPPVYGPTFEHVAEPNRVIEGTVREAGNGKPIAGVTLQEDLHTVYSNQPVTDAQGRFRFLGLRRSREYTVWFKPPAGTALIGRSVQVRDTGNSVDPIRVDVELTRGVIVTGRVFDQATGKGVMSRLHFLPLPGNKFADEASNNLSLYTRTDEDGRFRLVSIPGPGVLAAETARPRTVTGVRANSYLSSIYKPGRFSVEDRKRIKMIEEPKGFPVFITAAGVWDLDSYNVYKVVDLKEGEAASCDLGVDPGKILSVNLVDPDGKPLAGVTAWGVEAMRSSAMGIALTGTACPIFALDPENPRQVAFLHRERGLGATITLRGDESGPLTVRLERTGVITGRALDAEGLPMSHARIGVRYASRWGSGIVDFLQRRDELPRADENGRFRVEGIIPGLKFDLGFIEGKQSRFLPKTWQPVQPLEPGQTIGLGDVRIKPKP